MNSNSKSGNNRYLIPVVLGAILILSIVTAASAARPFGFGPDNPDKIPDAMKTGNGTRGPFNSPNYLSKFPKAPKIPGAPKNATNTTVPELNESYLSEEVPTYAAAEQKMEEADNETTGRFLLWTSDGEHNMSGRYGNGYFIGEDNLGKQAWGMYQRGVFAGFYDGEFFNGRYGPGWRIGSRHGFWRAENLFGEESSFGRYILSPAAKVKPWPFIEAESDTEKPEKPEKPEHLDKCGKGWGPRFCWNHTACPACPWYSINGHI